MRVTLQKLREEAARTFGKGVTGIGEGCGFTLVPHQTCACYCYLLDPAAPKHPSMALYGTGRSKMGARRALYELLKRVGPREPPAPSATPRLA